MQSLLKLNYSKILLRWLIASSRSFSNSSVATGMMTTDCLLLSLTIVTCFLLTNSSVATGMMTTDCFFKHNVKNRLLSLTIATCFLLTNSKD